jgi:hypothetical protein
MAKDNNSKKVNQNRYDTDVEGVSMKKLETGLWLIKNRGLFYKILVGILAAVIIIGWVYSLCGWGKYLFIGMANDARMMTSLVQSQVLDKIQLEQRKAKDLIYSSVGVLKIDGKYDLYATVRNPNDKHWGTFSFCFTTNTGEQSCGKDFILPGETKYVASFAQVFQTAPANVSFYITSMNWVRIDNHTIPDWNKYRDQRLNISIINPVFTPGEISSAAEKITINNLSFSALNNSPFGFWEAPLFIVLSNNNQIVGINKYTIQNFTSFETANVQIAWPGNIGPVDKITVTPEINIIDPSVYLQPR